mgnify:CR=1 FL=1
MHFDIRNHHNQNYMGDWILPKIYICEISKNWMKQLFSDSLDHEYAGGVNAAAEGVTEEVLMANEQ